MKKLLLSALLVGSFSLSSFAYDTAQADKLQNFYSHFTHKACANSKLFIEGDEVMKLIRDNAKVTLLDVRTVGEHSVVSIGLKNSLFIPIESLFKAENLKKLPLDQPILIVCHSGVRALLAAAGLKQIGIKDVRVVKDGIAGLAKADSAKNAPMK